MVVGVTAEMTASHGKISETDGKGYQRDEIDLNICRHVGVIHDHETMIVIQSMNTERIVPRLHKRAAGRQSEAVR
ncbi:MAG: hypothetical protein QF590_01400 [Dehalococcoidia bacterium]|nr:hypothetical protein [Dehalococcoidia bacterium]